MDQIVDIVGHSSFEGVHHMVHPFLHHLHLYDNVRRSRVCDGRVAYVLSFWSAWGIATLWPLLVSSLKLVPSWFSLWVPIVAFFCIAIPLSQDYVW